MEQNEFLLKDIYLAAFLYARGIKLIRVDREERLCWFVFDKENICLELQQEFFSRTAEVNAKDYANALRTLKDLIFS